MIWDGCKLWLKVTVEAKRDKLEGPINFCSICVVSAHPSPSLLVVRNLDVIYNVCFLSEFPPVTNNHASAILQNFAESGPELVSGDMRGGGGGTRAWSW